VAIVFAQEGDPRDYDTDAGILTFVVHVAPAAQPASMRCSFQLPSRDTGALNSERSVWHLSEFLSALQPDPWKRCTWPGSSTVTWTGRYRPACLRYRRASQVRDSSESGLAAPPGA
jgi:hypothetical protein